MVTQKAKPANYALITLYLANKPIAMTSINSIGQYTIYLPKIDNYKLKLMVLSKKGYISYEVIIDSLQLIKKNPYKLDFELCDIFCDLPKCEQLPPKQDKPTTLQNEEQKTTSKKQSETKIEQKIDAKNVGKELETELKKETGKKVVQKLQVVGELYSGAVSVPDATIKLMQNGKPISTAKSDKNGFFVFKEYPQGVYSLIILKVGYELKVISEIKLPYKEKIELKKL